MSCGSIGMRIIVVLFSLLLMAGTASAQVTGPAGRAKAGPGPELSAEKQKAVREFVTVDKPIPIKTSETLEVGEIAPNGIELLPLGGVGARVPEVARLKYFLSDRNVIVLVNPDNREIAYVIK